MAREETTPAARNAEYVCRGGRGVKLRPTFKLTNTRHVAALLVVNEETPGGAG